MLPWPQPGQEWKSAALRSVGRSKTVLVHRLGQLLQRRRRERPERDGPDHADPFALVAEALDGALGDTRADAVGHDDHLGVVGEVGLVADLVLLHEAELALELPVLLLLELGVEDQGVDRLGGPAFGAGDGPGLLVVRRPHETVEVDRLHHLAEDAVAEDDDRVAVLVRQVEGERHDLRQLLHRRGREDDGAVVAVTAAARGLEVVRLGPGDAPHTGAAAHDVDDDGGQLVGHQVGDALLLEAHAGAARRRHGARSGRRGAEHHVDGGDLALRLDEHAADARQAPGHVLGDLVLGRDGVPEVVGAPGEDGRLAQGDVAAHELLHDLLTSMATSGHMRAQLRQALQSLSSSKTATK